MNVPIKKHILLKTGLNQEEWGFELGMLGSELKYKGYEKACWTGWDTKLKWAQGEWMERRKKILLYLS